MGGGNERGGGERDPRREWADLFGDRPQRVERGGVRYLVLDALTDAERHGYEIMQVIDERSRGAYRPSPGVIYPTLQMLEELGHVRVTQRDDKRVYAITPTGSRELAAHRGDVTGFYEQSEDVWEDHGEDLKELMQRVRLLLRAFRRSARRGRLTPEVMAGLRVILDEAVAKLEALVTPPGADDKDRS